MRANNTAIATCLTCILACTAYADDTTVPVVSSGPTVRAQAANPATGPDPYSLQLMYTGEEWHNSGGASQGSLYMQNVYTALHVNAADAFGLTGGSFQLSGFYNSARSLDTTAGTYIDQSVIDTGGTEMTRLYEAYYQQRFGNDTNVLFGLHDLETEFGHTKPMELFFGGSYAWTATLDQSGPGTNSPTYPTTPLTLRLQHNFDDHWTVLAALADGEPDSVKYPRETTVQFNRNYGALLIGEVDYRTTNRTKLMVGYWGYTGKFDDFSTTDAGGDMRQTYGSTGGYLGGTTRLYDQGQGRGLDVFATIGWADPTVNQADRTFNAGLTYTGPLDIRPTDKLGIAISSSGASDAYRQSQMVQGIGVNTYETNFEATYRTKICDWLTVQPDMQYFIDPNMDPTLKNDFVVGIHFEFGHVFDF